MSKSQKARRKRRTEGQRRKTAPMPVKPEPVKTEGVTGMAVGICAALAILIFAVFGQTLGHQFVEYDDPGYVYANPEILRGLSWEGVAWAFTHVHKSNWHPLTTLSHMLDCQLFGLNPSGHHAINVLLHAGTAVVFFWVLWKMTGSLWRSAFVAAIFAIHPLRVESVAWVSERKDLLSGLFFMLILWAYLHYVRGPRWTRYGLVAALFVLGLLTKPMLVTVPFVLLLLDYWPLRRYRVEAADWRIIRNLLVEKLPLIALSAASCIATLIAQRDAITPFERLPLLPRVCNAIVAYLAYIWQMFWPAHLAVLYPLKPIEPWKVILSLLLLGGITAGVIRLRRTHAYLWTGWGWYLIMLIPVIGIVQVGSQARADRYTYLPQIGLTLAMTWLVADIGARARQLLLVEGSVAVFVVVVLSLAAHKQTYYWRNTEALWDHTLRSTRDNHIALNNVAWILATRPETSLRNGADAVKYAERANELTHWENPSFLDTLAAAYAQAGRFSDALKTARHALKLAEQQPNSALVEALKREIKLYEAGLPFQTGP
jgi:hypothetical protein